MAGVFAGATQMAGGMGCRARQLRWGSCRCSLVGETAGAGAATCGPRLRMAPRSSSRICRVLFLNRPRLLCWSGRLAGHLPWPLGVGNYGGSGLTDALLEVSRSRPWCWGC
jgi:hypothetical protein